MLILYHCDKVIQLNTETHRREKMYFAFRFKSSFPHSREGVREHSRWIQLNKAGQEVEELSQELGRLSPFTPFYSFWAQSPLDSAVHTPVASLLS